MALRHIAGPFRFSPPHVAGDQTYFLFSIFADEDNGDQPFLLAQGWSQEEIASGEHLPYMRDDAPAAPPKLELIKSTVVEAKCERCGSAENVTYGPDPYASEIGGDETPVWQCEKCNYESAMDI